ncbi:unnamed protein product [Linum tenue]|uniref:Uncharacterized protein n=1 Tax=Linum tenue TaxID=586396 RepID=A0AAV0P2M2_9ROSI|nr:unnamed protein product [Linum tenue]
MLGGFCGQFGQL